MKPKKIKFKPKPGQVDYTNIRWAPVINCVVRYKDTILLVQRSKELRFYPGYWNGISGFLDDKRSLEEKVRVELQEETGIAKKDIKKIRLGKIFHLDAPKYKKTWIVHSVLVDVKTNKVKLDWEGQDYKWVKPEEIKTLKLLGDFNRVLEGVSSLWNTK